MKHYIYTGSQRVYSLQGPKPMSFPKGVPIGVDDLYTRFLPTADFKEWEPKKDKAPSSIDSILIKLPWDYKILYTVRLVERVREYYPLHPITLLTDEVYKPLFKHIDNVTLVKSITVRPGLYYKEINVARTPKNSPCFDGGATMIHSYQFCYLLYTQLNQGEDSNLPTLIPIKKKEPVCIGLVKQGDTQSNSWKALGDYLESQPFSLPIKVIDGLQPFDKILNELKDTAFLVSTANTPVSLLSAYIGIPVFSFVPSKQDVQLMQLEAHFNKLNPNASSYGLFNTEKTFTEIYRTIKTYIDSVIQKPNVAFKPETPQREKLTIEEPVKERRGRSRFKTA